MRCKCCDNMMPVLFREVEGELLLEDLCKRCRDLITEYEKGLPDLEYIDDEGLL